MDISIRSGDIRAQSEKASEIGPKLACFLLPNFWTGVIKLYIKKIASNSFNVV